MSLSTLRNKSGPVVYSTLSKSQAFPVNDIPLTHKALRDEQIPTLKDHLWDKTSNKPSTSMPPALFVASHDDPSRQEGAADSQAYQDQQYLSQRIWALCDDSCVNDKYPCPLKALQDPKKYFLTTRDPYSGLYSPCSMCFMPAARLSNHGFRAPGYFSICAYCFVASISRPSMQDNLGILQDPAVSHYFTLICQKLKNDAVQSSLGSYLADAQGFVKILDEKQMKMAEEVSTQISQLLGTVNSIDTTLKAQVSDLSQIYSETTMIEMVEKIVSFLSHALVVYLAPTATIRAAAALAWISSLGLVSKTDKMIRALGVILAPDVITIDSPDGPMTVPLTPFAQAHTQDTNIFSGFITALAHSIGLGGEFDSKIDDARLKSFNVFVSSMKSVEYVISKIIEGIKFIISVVSGAPMGSDAQIKELKDEIDIWMQSATDIQMGDILATIQKSEEPRIQVEMLYASSLELLRKCTLYGVNNNTLFYPPFAQAVKSIAELKMAVLAIRRQGIERSQPAVLFLYGPPQQGKSFMTKAICRAWWIRRFPNIPFNYKQCTFTKNPTDKYWDGYHNQRILILDDPFQVSTPEALVLVCSEIIHLVNDSDYKLDMSSISDKAGVYFDSDMIVISSNRERPIGTETKLQDHNAFYSRLHVPVKVELKKEFQNAQGTIDLAKVKALPEGTPIHNLQLADTLVRDYESQGKKMVSTTKFTPTTVDEIVDLLFTQMQLRGHNLPTLAPELAPTPLDDAQRLARFEAMKKISVDKHLQMLHKLKKALNNAESRAEKRVLGSYVEKLEADIQLIKDRITIIDVIPDSPVLGFINGTNSQMFTSFLKKTLFFGQPPVPEAGSPATSDTHDYENPESMTRGYHPISIEEEETVAAKLPFILKISEMADFTYCTAYDVTNTAHQNLAQIAARLQDALRPYFSISTKSALAIQRLYTPTQKVLLSIAGLLAVAVGGIAFYKAYQLYRNNTAPAVTDLIEEESQANLESGDPKTNRAAYVVTKRNPASGRQVVQLQPVSQMGEVNLDIARLAANNTGIARWTDGISDISGHVRIFMIKGKLGFLPYHFICRRKATQKFLHLTFVNNVKYLIPINVMQHAEYGADLSLVYLNSTRFPEFRDITHHICPPEDIGNVSRVAIVHYSPSDTFCSWAGEATIGGHQQYRDKELEVVFTLSSHIKVEVQGQGGWCCSPYVALNDSMQRKIIGLHVAGDNYNSFGHMLPDLDDLVPQSQMSWDFPDGTHQIGEVPRKLAPVLPLKTEIMPSAVQGILAEKYADPPITRPAPLRPFYDVNGTLISPLEESLKKFKKLERDPKLDHSIEPEIDEWCIRNLFNYKHEIRIYSIEEAINGPVGNTYIKAMDLSKSAGYSEADYYTRVPKSQRGGCAFLFEERDDPKGRYKYPIPPFEHDIKTFCDESQLPKDQRTLTKFYIENCLKDERRSLEKCQKGLARVFQILPRLLIVVQRMVFGSLVESIMSDPFNWFSISINPHSVHWQKLLSNMQKFGINTKYLPGDFSNFDASLFDDHHWRLNTILRTYLARRGISQYWLNVIDRIQEETRIPIYLVMCFLWQPDQNGDNPSGQFLTAIMNCLENIILHMECAITVARRKGVPSLFRDNSNGSRYGPDDYNNDFFLCTLGDDHVETTHVEWYTMAEKAAEMLRRGFKYTDCHKRPIGDVKWYSLEEVTYLKRTFKWLDGRVVAQLDPKTITEIPKWIRKCSVPPKVCTTINCESARREWFHYGRQKYEEMDLYYSRVLAEAGCPPMKVISYDEILEQYFPTGRNWTSVDDILAETQMETFVDDMEVDQGAEFEISRLRRLLANSTVCGEYVPAQRYLKPFEHVVPILPVNAYLVPLDILLDLPDAHMEKQETDQVNGLTKQDDNVVEEILVPEVRKPVSAILDFPDPYNRNDVYNVLNRQVKFTEFVWSSTDSDASCIKQMVFPQDIMNVSAYMLNVLQNYRYFRSPIELEFRVNSTDWHFGQLMISYLPCGYNNLGDPWTPTNSASATGKLSRFATIRQASVNPVAILSAQRKNVVKFTIPYLNDQLWYDLSDLGGENSTFGRMGICTVWVSAPLNQIGTTATPSVNVSVFGRFMNPEVTALLPIVTTADPSVAIANAQRVKSATNTSNNNNHRTSSAPVLGLSRSKKTETLPTSQMSDKPTDAMTKTRDAKQSSGKISGVLSTASRVARFLKPFPIVGSFAAGVEPLADIAAKVTGLLGYSRNTSNVPIAKMYPAPTGNLVSGHDLDISTKLALDPDNKVDADWKNFCTEKDFDLLTNYCRIPQLMYRGSITSTTPQETVFLSIPITPCATITEFISPGACFPSPQANVAMLHRYWSGSQNIRVDFICSSRTTARIRASWLKYTLNSPPPLVNDNDAANIVSEVFDITGDTTKYFNIPYVDKYPWKKTYTPADDPADEDDPYNGFLVFTIINSPTSADSSVSTAIYYNTWIAGGGDLQFSRPQDLYIQSTDYTGQVFSQMSEKPSLIAGPEFGDYPRECFMSDFPSMLPATALLHTGVSCGERTSRWSELSSRYTVASLDTMASSSINKTFGWFNIMNQYNVPWESFNSRFWNAFLAYRGSLRFQQITIDPGYTIGTQTHMTNVHDSEHVPYNGLAGFAMSDAITRLPINVEVPYYSQLPFQIRDVRSEAFGVGYRINSTTSGSRTVLYMSSGEDFSFGYPIAPNAVFVPNT